MFTNNTVLPEQLPSIREVPWQKLDPRYPRMVLLHGLALWLAAGAVGLALTLNAVLPLTLAGLGLLWSLLLVPSLLSWPAARVKRYAVREHDVLFREGLLWKSTTVLPRNRIQHIETENGPLERWYGLVTLKCYGAGGHQADLVIPGLEQHHGQRLRQYLLDEAEDEEDRNMESLDAQ